MEESRGEVAYIVNSTSLKCPLRASSDANSQSGLYMPPAASHLRRVMLRVVVLLALSVFATNCHFPFVSEGCDTYADPGLEVTVRAAESGAALENGVKIVAFNATLADSASGVLPGGVASLLMEKSGTFTVRVSAPGRVTWERAGVRVTKDECHVRLTRVTATLSRAEP